MEEWHVFMVILIIVYLVAVKLILQRESLLDAALAPIFVLGFMILIFFAWVKNLFSKTRGGNSPNL